VLVLRPLQARGIANISTANRGSVMIRAEHGTWATMLHASPLAHPRP
jgi:hypothetical protein